jgi:RNA polymerase sigma factor (sigma-70 family)
MARGLDPPPPLSDQLLRQVGWTRRLARSLLGDESAAEDTLQETWEAAARKPPETDRPVEPWLRRTIRNRLLNRAREQRRRTTREEKTIPGAAPDSPEELLARLEIHKKLVEAVARLPEPYRQTVLLRYFQELNSADIAARLHVPAATVRGRLKTAVDLLREELDRGPGGRRAWVGVMLVLAGPGGVVGTERLVGMAKVAAHGSAKTLALAIGALTIGALALRGFVSSDEPAPPAARLAAQASPPTPPSPKRRVERPVTSAPPPVDPPPTAPPPVASVVPPPASSPAAPALASLYSISGRVHLAGNPLPPPAIDMSADPFCAAQPKTEDDAVVVNKDGMLANAVVTISRGLPAGPPPATPVVIEQRGCRYQPRVVVAQAGQEVEFRNSDQTVHAVHSWSGNRWQRGGSGFTGSQAQGTPPLRTKVTSAGETIQMKCDRHPWMTAVVFTTDNPYFAITDREGRYAIQGLRAGTYTVQAQHEAVPWRYSEVTVGPGVAAEEVDFVLGNVPRGGPDGCRLARRYDGPVVSACRDGGIKQAKSVMKRLQKQGKEQGLKHECDDCHKDEAAGNWTLHPNAYVKFDQLLRVARDRRDPRKAP